MTTRYPGLRSIAVNGLALAGSRGVEAGLRGVYALAIAHILSAEAYGAWAYVLSAYVVFLGSASFGFDALIPARLGREREGARAEEFLSMTFALRIGLLLLAAIGLALYAIAGEPAPELQTALFLVLPALMARGIALWTQQVFIGLELSGVAARLMVGFRLFEVAAGGTLLWSGGGIEALLILHAVSWLAQAALSVILAEKRIAFKIMGSLDGAADFLRQGAPLGLAGLFGAWLIAGPLILLRHASDDLAAVGDFGLAMQLAFMIAMLAGAVLSAAMPVLSRSVARDDPRADSYGVWVACGAIAIGLIAGALGALLGEPLAEAALGPRYAPVGAALGPACLFAALSLAPQGVRQLFVLRRRVWAIALTTGLGAAAMTVSAGPAIAALGPSGAAWAGAIGMLAQTAALFALRR